MSNLTIPLYHGTDMKNIKLTEEERLALKDNILRVNEYFKNLYSANNFKISYNLPESHAHEQFLQEKLKNDYLGGSNFYDVVASEYKLSQYQYGNLYLTGDYYKACSYAKRSNYFGELGLIAYKLWKSADLLGYEYNKTDISKEINVLKPYWEKPGIPVVLRFINLQKEDLLTDDGEKNSINMPDICFELGSFRFIGKKLPEYEIIENIEKYGKELNA